LEHLERRFDSLEDVIKTNNDLIKEAVTEMRRSNDTNKLHLEFIQRDNLELKGMTQRLEESVKLLQLENVRLAQLEKYFLDFQQVIQYCQNRTSTPAPAKNFDEMANQWLHSKVAERVFWATGIIATLFLTKYFTSL